MVKSLFNVGAVLPAAGLGTRFGEKKQFKYLANKPLFLYSLNIFLKCKKITEIVIVTNKEDVEYIYKETESLKTKKHIKVIAGGPRRQDSVMNGCLALSNSIKFVTIHDIVRNLIEFDNAKHPFITESCLLGPPAITLICFLVFNDSVSL
jgi:2-C-methyl-D-erythritol 4-phosphate cytidylyltransferase